ncbi:ATP-binding cassette subfamily C protein [Rhizobium sp. SG_E_25_P2]|nr:ATP-binding cassette subfamily C protein [Rhizobium sp. SG_E_25_P2]
MIQVYGRVLPGHSFDTLYGLIVIAAFAVVIYGLLEFARSWIYGSTALIIAQRLNLPALQASVLRSIEGGVAEGGHAIRNIVEIRRFITGSAISMPLEAVWSVVFLAALYFIHPVYLYVTLGFIAITILLNFVTDRLTRSVIDDANKAQQRHVEEVAGSMRHAETIEAMGMLPALVRMWRRSQQEMLKYSEVAEMRSRAVLAILKSLTKSLQMVVVTTGAVLVLDGSIHASVLFAAMIMSSQAVQPFSSMVENWRKWINAAAAWKNIIELVNTEGSLRDTMPAPVGDGFLSVENLTYLPGGRDLPVLRNITFSVNPGEVLGVIGPSGAGKTTLARCLTGILKPTVGGVYLDGHSTYLWERGSFGKAVGYLPQGLSLIDGTIRQTIARMQESDPRDVIRAARAAGIHDLVGRLPQGYDTPVREGLHLLSGGQMQRVALARALYNDPKLLILDEPNSNLDNLGEEALIEAIDAAKKRGAIVVMIAHRPSVMAIADKILVIEHGSVSKFGPRSEVIGGPPEIKAVPIPQNGVVKLLRSAKASDG